MSLHKFIEKRSDNVKKIKLDDIKDFMKFRVLKNCIAFYKNQKFYLQKDDLLIAENHEAVSNFRDKLVQLTNPDDIINVYMYMGNEGYLEIPLNRDSLTPMALIFNPVTKELEFSSTGIGGGSLTVSEVDGSPSATVTNLVFNGRAGVGGETVIIVDDTAYINGVAPPSPLGGNLSVSGLTRYIGRESQSNINYEGSAGDSHNYLANDGTFNLSISTFNFASIGNLVATINGIDTYNIDLLANFNELNREGTQNLADYNNIGTGFPNIINGVASNAGGSLQLTGVNWTDPVGADQFQDGSFNLNITPTALRQGYNYITVSHNGNTTNTFQIFYDIDSGANPYVTVAELDLRTLIAKVISGVTYCYTGTIFDLDFLGNNCFNNVYHNSNAPIVMSSSWGISGGILYTDPNVSSVSTPPDIGETMITLDKPITVVSGQEENDARITLTPRDPYGNYASEQTPSNNIMIMSIPNSSDRVTENFVDETYRFPLTTDTDIIPGGMTGNWNSNSLLGANDLQVYSSLLSNQSSLIYPQDDLSSHIPVGNPDYSVLSGGTGKQFLRICQGIVDNSNGVLTLPGITDADLASGNIIIDIKVPTKTVWLRAGGAGSDFVFGTFNTNANLSGGINGEGCRINTGVHSPDIDGSIEFTLGTYASDASVSRYLWVRITYANVTVPRNIEAGLGLNW